MLRQDLTGMSGCYQPVLVSVRPITFDFMNGAHEPVMGPFACAFCNSTTPHMILRLSLVHLILRPTGQGILPADALKVCLNTPAQWNR